MKHSELVSKGHLHPTKGWRSLARPQGTNRRRKLIRLGEMELLGKYRVLFKSRFWREGRDLLPTMIKANR